MKRGDLVTVALQGDYGKVRPALVIQSDFFNTHPSLTILPITSDLHDAPLFRITVEPNEQNGLKHTSQIMIDKAHTISREKAGDPFGNLDSNTLLSINRSLAVFLGFG